MEASDWQCYVDVFILIEAIENFSDLEHFRKVCDIPDTQIARKDDDNEDEVWAQEGRVNQRGWEGHMAPKRIGKPPLDKYNMHLKLVSLESDTQNI